MITPGAPQSKYASDFQATREPTLTKPFLMNIERHPKPLALTRGLRQRAPGINFNSMIHLKDLLFSCLT